MTLQEHGGLAAAINRVAAVRVADTRLLPPQQAEELARLAEAALGTDAAPPAGPAASSAGRGAARDAMSYTVTVEDTGATRVLNGSDTDASPQLADLVRFLQDHAR
ncbi:protealysin inhibitor emfourin [Actinoplanes sp. NPDC051475]|uniref:protealysin inhibitor emfourin n=1 Tax=Actinoplanes sp. NPDC051475 TaxID=3157225 RepID=UPI00345014C9